MRRIALACSVLCGCSFAIMRPSPRVDAGTKMPYCESAVVAGVDLGAMTLAGFLALSQVAKAIGGCEGAGGVECGEAALRNAAIIAGVGGVFFVSAIYGFAAKSSCHAKAKAAVSASGGTQ